MFNAFGKVEHSDCGLTCIRMIAKSYGINIPSIRAKRSILSFMFVEICVHNWEPLYYGNNWLAEE